jgi:hypothetical protein
MQSDVRSWEQQGLVSLWRYTKSGQDSPGWHLTADPLGALSLISLLRLVDQSDVGSSVTLALTAPLSSALRVPNKKGGSVDVVAPTQWRIEHGPEGHGSGTWHFPAGVGTANLSISGPYVGQLISGLESIARGHGDASVGSSLAGSSVLWLWWLPRPT